MINFLRRLVLLIWIPVVAAGLTVVIAEFLVIRDFVPMYESMTGIYVGRVMEDSEEVGNMTGSYIFDDFQVSKEIMQNIPALIDGNILQNKVINNLVAEGMDTGFLSPGYFENNVSTEIINNTNVIHILVTHPDPTVAQKVSGEIAEVAEEMYTDLIKIDYLTVISEANYPTEPSGLSKNALRILAGIGGVLIGVVIVFFIAAAEENTY